MAFKNDGGNFSGNAFTRLRAMTNGGSMSTSDLDDMDKVPQDAIDTASGVVGSIGSPGSGILSKLAGAGEQAVADVAPSFAQRIQQAAANGSVKVIPTAEQAANDAMKAQYANAPSFFEKYGAQGKGFGGASDASDDAMRAYQGASRNADMESRINQQISDTTKQKFNQLMQAMGKR
jgi:hypothetical protein